jgi:ABC-type multidrug transport system fused ATPase/permease subunit
MINTISKVWEILTSPQKLRAIALLGMVTIMAFFDALGVVSIVPFLSVLANPEIINSSPLVANLQQYYVFRDEPITASQLLFYLGAIVLLFFLLSLAFKAWTEFCLTRFALMCEYSLCSRIFSGYLRNSYSWFLSKNGNDLGKNILSEVSQVTHYVLLPLINLFAHGAVVLALSVTLFIFVGKYALVIGLGTLIIYSVIFNLLRKYIIRFGIERTAANQKRYAIVGEAFSSVKIVKASAFEEKYIRKFDEASRTYAVNQAAAISSGNLPRFAVEAAAISVMISLVLYFLFTEQSELKDIVPALGLYGLAGYRLLPSLQQIYKAFSNLQFANLSLEIVHRELPSLGGRCEKDINNEFNDSEEKALTFCRELKLVSLSYRHVGAAENSVSDISLVIPAGSKVGIIGGTGSGKTTLIDLVICLLEADGGSIEVDGTPINSENRRQWQRMIGYVPQHVSLLDDTVEANIAHGVPEEKIDSDRVRDSARIARAHDFISNDLEMGYKTIIGEQGARLSGGERQRLALARALYRNPKILVLDEATSALDNQTEREIIDKINNCLTGITVVMVAHRVNTLRNCNVVVELKKGKIVAMGDFGSVVKEY